MNKFATITVCLLTFLLSAPALAQKTAGEHLDDTTITASVKYALLENSESDGANINVETSKGVVQLAGFVESEKAKSIAMKIAKDVSGVVAVSNRMRVFDKKRSAGQKLDDSVLESKVKLKLAGNKATDAGKINVEVRLGLVELSGFVNSYEDRNIAVTFVSDINGVKEVINAIDITH